MAASETIDGYAFGSTELESSPVSQEELAELERAALFDEADAEALRELWRVVADRRQELFAVWMERVAHYFLPTFAGPDGRPIEAYLDAAHGRFMRWIEDTCLRPHDAAWLDYQHEIGLRHHRTRKNRTDGVDSVPAVPLRLLIVALHPLTSTLGPFLRGMGVDESRAARLSAAWAKALHVQVALWSRAYVDDCW